jgi:hypothetical protein
MESVSDRATPESITSGPSCVKSPETRARSTLAKREQPPSFSMIRPETFPWCSPTKVAHHIPRTEVKLQMGTRRVHRDQCPASSADPDAGVDLQGELSARVLRGDFKPVCRSNQLRRNPEHSLECSYVGWLQNKFHGLLSGTQRPRPAALRFRACCNRGRQHERRYGDSGWSIAARSSLAPIYPRRE